MKRFTIITLFTVLAMVFGLTAFTDQRLISTKIIVNKVQTEMLKAFEQSDTILVENIVQFYKHSDINNLDVDAINFILKVTNRSENPIPDLGVTNRTKHVKLYINGQINNPSSLYNGVESIVGVKEIDIDSTQTFDSGGWILSSDSGLLTKYGNEFTIYWEYMGIKSNIIQVNLKNKTLKPIEH